MVTAAVLEARGLSYAYAPGQWAVRAVDLQIRRGTRMALLGANGAGKSTKLKTISGLLRPKRGEVRYEGQPLHTLAPNQIVRLGISHCPEGRRIFGGLSVEENLRLGAVQRRDSTAVRSDIERMYTLFPRLKDRRNQAGGTLSGGEQQMLAISRALMSRPKVLLLDEPSLGLAPLLVETIFATIAQLKRAQTTILLVEQNAAQALRRSDRAYILETGNVTRDGTAADLLADDSVRAAYLGVA